MIQLTDEERKMEERDSIEFTAPGFSGKVRGASWTSREVIVVIIVISCTAFLYLERIQSNKGFADNHAITQAQNVVTQSMLASVLKGQSKLAEEISEGTQINAFVLSLSQAQREKLNLSMPPSLRARISSKTQRKETP